MHQVVVVEPLDSKDLANLTLLDRTELGITFTKVLFYLSILVEHLEYQPAEYLKYLQVEYLKFLLVEYLKYSFCEYQLSTSNHLTRLLISAPCFIRSTAGNWLSSQKLSSLMPTLSFSRTVMNFLKGKSSRLPQASCPSSSWLFGPLSSSLSSQLLWCILASSNLLCFWISDKIFYTDAGWPDCFNSGVFVFRPNLNTYADLVCILFSFSFSS